MSFRTDAAPGASAGRRGDAALRDGRLNDAIRAYREALAADPGSAWLHQSLGEVSARKGWFLVASTLFRRARQLDADAVARWFAVHTPVYATDTPIPSPVFVLGCQHSGTTITTRILGNHPRLMHAEARETHLFAAGAAEVSRRLREWDLACVAAGRSRWVEKSVVHTYMVPKLLAARPHARLVLVVRDGRDVVASIKTRQYAFSGFDDLVRCWTQANDILLGLQGQPGTVLVRYEDLVRQPRTTLQAICAAIGEDYSDDMLRYDDEWIAWNGMPRVADVGELDGYLAHHRLRTWQVNQPLFDGSGRWRTDLTSEEQARFRVLGQAQLERFGYADSPSW